MTLIADTGALYALYDADDGSHEAVLEALETDPGPLVVPTAILAEIDYLLREFLGVDAELDFLTSLRTGAFLLDTGVQDDLERIQALVAQYRDLDLGLADAAVIATAERLEARKILTLDERDFRAIRHRDGGTFTLWPADRVS